MRTTKPLCLACLAAIVLLARSGNSQTFGFYSTWSYDGDSGNVYCHAETWADYEIAYYYDAYVFMQLSVTPAQGSSYWTCQTSSSSDSTAQVDCSTIVTGTADLLFNSYHRVRASYYYYQFVSNCMSACYNWYDGFGLTNLGVNGQSFADNMFWYAPGGARPVSYQATAQGVINRTGSLRPCSFPTGESSAFYDWAPGDTPYFMAGFIGMLQPTTVSFDNRVVGEDLTPSLPFDTCKNSFPNSPYSAWNPPSAGPGGTVGSLYRLDGVYLAPSHNNYGLDYIGFPNAFSPSVTWYQNQIRNGGPITSCGWNVEQRMYMAGCAGSPSQYYEQSGHSIGVIITGSAVSIYRTVNAYASR